MLRILPSSDRTPIGESGIIDSVRDKAAMIRRRSSGPPAPRPHTVALVVYDGVSPFEVGVRGGGDLRYFRRRLRRGLRGAVVPPVGLRLRAFGSAGRRLPDAGPARPGSAANFVF